MEIKDRASAIEWLHSWANDPRPGMLTAAIEGLEKSLSIAKSQRASMSTISNYVAAIKTLRSVVHNAY